MADNSFFRHWSFVHFLFQNTYHIFDFPFQFTRIGLHFNLYILNSWIWLLFAMKSPWFLPSAGMNSQFANFGIEIKVFSLLRFNIGTQKLIHKRKIVVKNSISCRYVHILILYGPEGGIKNTIPQPKGWGRSPRAKEWYFWCYSRAHIVLLSSYAILYENDMASKNGSANFSFKNKPKNSSKWCIMKLKQGFHEKIRQNNSLTHDPIKRPEKSNARVKGSKWHILKIIHQCHLIVTNNHF